MTFPVTGVDVDKLKSRCDKDSCDLLLTNLHKPQSSGAYRCEVSSESPQFLLASETHLVTMAGKLFFFCLNLLAFNFVGLLIKCYQQNRLQ